jgi:hypothetical protein
MEVDTMNTTLVNCLLAGLALLCVSCAAPRPADNAPGGTVAAGSGGVQAKKVPTGPQVLIPGSVEGDDTAIDLPAWPADGDLVEMRQYIRPDLFIGVDTRSLQVTSGGEIRYTFVVRNASGARTVTFEAMRCPDRERMILATGTAERTWVPARFFRWQPINVNDILGQRTVLHTEYFCAALLPINSVKEGAAALRAGGHPRLK